MGHFVTGIIVKECDAENIATVIPFKKYYKLNQDYVIFPFTDDLIDAHIPAPQNFKFDEFTYLSEELENILSSISTEKFITYIETEYHGGQGGQAAIVYKNGDIVFGPKNADVGPISEALKLIGVVKECGHHDEFQSIGLGGFRSSEELLENG